METVGDITDRRGVALPWMECRQMELPESLRGPYEKLLGNLNLDVGRVKRSSKLVDIFLAQGRIKNGSSIWKFQIECSGMKEIFGSSQNPGECCKMFTH